ncbi:M1 family aminopeptidase [Fulvivirgaceae bacterium BMA12]|uniref:M1 family aminopeptidase n=1 Tax=Agaribacillus aureus TaxID=3051825 RepID=A0ABT8LAX1_9BACT|nr:M1 family aminopeptidase [Fulvivirgaceae bacterium BMA12]
MNKHHSSKLLLFTLWSLSFLSAQGQTVRLTGKIVDHHTRESIPFAHLVIESTGIGAISDLYGYFKLDFPEQYRAGMIHVSCLGYKPVKLSLGSLDRSKIEIRLQQDVVQLREVVIKPEDPIDLLREAFRRIPENYDTTMHTLSGYYKMSALLDDKNIRYTEAFIDIFKFPYHAYREDSKAQSDSIQLRAVRIKPNEIKDWKLHTMLPWEKSIYHLGYRDIVKEFCSEKNAFKKFTAGYHFDLETMVLINGRRTYKIRVAPKKNKSYIHWNGYIFLDEATKAFVKVDFVSTPKLLKKLKAQISYILASKLYKVNYERGEWKESINFQLIGAKWYFKEVNSSKRFLISSKKRKMDRVPVNVNLHYNTDSVKSNVTIPDTVDFWNLNEAWWVKEKHMANQYDESFWQTFDRRKGTLSNEVFLNKSDSTKQEKQVYKFTRLDTLQGALTPLRTCFDVGFYHLDVEVVPDEEIIKGSSLVRFKVVDPTDKIQIDLYSEMAVDSVIYLGKSLNFNREFNAVYIDFPKTLQKESVVDIKVYFSGHPVDFDPKIPMYAAFLWVADKNRDPWLQAICQGYGASGWWPNKDHLSDEPDSAAISVTVPSHLSVIANGRLRRKTAIDGDRTRFDWFVSYPINNYNLTLNAGKYAHIKDRYTNGIDTLDLDYHVMHYNLETARQKLGMVKPMLKTYEKYFGAYPFPRDGFKLVETPHAMEHQSCVALGYEYFTRSDEINDDTSAPDFANGVVDFQIVLHEAAHEWWGNSISCTDNAELWIHEAFATYAEALFVEDHYSYADAQVYLNWMKKLVKNKAPVIGKFDVNHIHYDIGDMYYKGALMLNTLRHVINNDRLWFAILKGIQTTFKYKTVNTEQIVRYINQKTGADYTNFFYQYLRTTNIPVLELAFENTAGKTHLHYRWIADVEGFTMPVKYAISGGEPAFLYPDNRWQKLVLGNVSKDDFKVNTHQFYIDVKVRDSRP